jgi:hypothetical protein
MEGVEYSCSCPFSQMVVAVGRAGGHRGPAVKAQEEIYWCGDEECGVEVRQLAGSPAQPSPPPLLSLMMMTSPTMANPFASWPPSLCSAIRFFSRLCDDLDESTSFPSAPAPEGSLTIRTAFNGRKGAPSKAFEALGNLPC